MNEAHRVEKLRADHPIESLDCGRDELSRYLLLCVAKPTGGRGANLCWARGRCGHRLLHSCRGSRDAGGSAGASDQRPRAHPIPIMLLPRLAVDHRWQGRVGKALLKDAMLRTLQAADIAGIRAFAVHAKDEEARRFYLNFDFTPPLRTRCISLYSSRTFGVFAGLRSISLDADLVIAHGRIYARPEPWQSHCRQRLPQCNQPT